MILIKGVQIVDGTGTRKPYKAEVLVKGDRISAIGSFPNKKSNVTIDGLGSYLVPGFIDVKTNADHYLSLFHNPEQGDFLKQGVTTIMGGHCGSSLAPLIYGTLESIRKWADINSINVDWHTFGEFLSTMERRPLGVNFGSLAGHSTIRRALIGEEIREIDPKELEVFVSTLARAMDEGAFGMSTGLGYAHSRQTPYEEIKMLVSEVAKRKGVYTTHLRNEEAGLLASVNETIKIAEETGATTIISHFRPLVGSEKEYQDALYALANIPQSANVYFDLYPYATSVVAIYTLLPEWAQNGGFEVMMRNLETAATRAKILAELPEFKGDEVIISQALHHDYLVGKSLAELAENRAINMKEALLQIMMLTNLRSMIFYKNVNREIVEDAIMHKNALVASNSAGLAEAQGSLKHERFYNTFPRFLELVAQHQHMTFEQAIQKITSVPAALFGLKDRGEVREGAIADLVLVKDNKIEAVLVNGQLSVTNGEVQRVLAGKVLRHG